MIFNKTYAAYLNLDIRPDRNEHMIKELDRVGIVAERIAGKNPDDYQGTQYEVMRRRTPGAIGCYEGQKQIMQVALIKDKHALVMEDDLVFCDDFKERCDIINQFLVWNRDWDLIWFGGTYHKEPTWHRSPHPQDMKHCHCSLNRDYEETGHPNIVRTYGAFSTHCYLVNRDSIAKILRMLEENLSRSQGIDHNFIYLQPQLETFAFVPGCVKQFDNQSNIGNGMTYFSGFAKLGDHWFKETM